MPHRSARITEDQAEFLDKNPEVNFSGLVRQAIEHRMEIERQLNQMSFAGSLQEAEDKFQFTTRSGHRDKNTERGKSVTIQIEPEGDGYE